MRFCALIFGILDCDFDCILGNLCDPSHQLPSCLCERRAKGDVPGIGDDGDITPLEPLLGILRDLLSVGVEDMISTLDDRDSDLGFK
jgi:hypothetical protein